VTKPQTVLITGTATGMGFVIAKTLAAQGHTVFATMRDVDGRNAGPAAALRDQTASAPGKLTVLELDVTSDESVERAFAQALEQGPIDVVINNAALGSLYQLEAFTPAQFQQVFDVNVFGMQRVNRAVLPHMRERGRGLIMQISSTGGRLVFPFNGPYIGSKFALEALLETYRYELAGSGVDVVIVEPGGFATDYCKKALVPEDQATLQAYGPGYEVSKAFWSVALDDWKAYGGGPDLQLVGDAVAKIIATPAGQRPLRVVVDTMFAGQVEAINACTTEQQAQVLGIMQMSELVKLRVTE
jgi:NAD(P)-dependent dehydrogenase (short-subunit alcohol dehydrogenase family)